jgi:hypothetical protein
MKYFENCHTAADCKARYRELAKQLHPDKQGGSNAAFAKMQAEYEARLAELIQGARPNSIEYQKLVLSLLDILKVVKPEYYELVKLFGNNPKVSIVSQLICELFPQKASKVNEILKILQ